MSGISTDLMDLLREYVGHHAEMEVLDATSVARIADAVADAFVDDREHLWWWESLRTPAKVGSYGKNDGLAHLQMILGCKSGSLVLVVTDDEGPPWSAVRGALPRLIGMLRDHQYFEYFLVDDSFSWIVFDTHHNALVIAGEIT